MNASTFYTKKEIHFLINFIHQPYNLKMKYNQTSASFPAPLHPHQVRAKMHIE